VTHETQEEGEVVPVDPLLVEGQEIGTPRGVQHVVGVFDTLRDPLEGEEFADVVMGEERDEFFLGDVGVDCHAPLLLRPSR
jgi:hypothetical protein